MSSKPQLYVTAAQSAELCRVMDQHCFPEIPSLVGRSTLQHPKESSLSRMCIPKEKHGLRSVSPQQLRPWQGSRAARGCAQWYSLCSQSPAPVHRAMSPTTPWAQWNRGDLKGKKITGLLPQASHGNDTSISSSARSSAALAFNLKVNIWLRATLLMGESQNKSAVHPVLQHPLAC